MKINEIIMKEYTVPWKKKMELILNCYNYFETKQDAQN